MGDSDYGNDAYFLADLVEHTVGADTGRVQPGEFLPELLADPMRCRGERAGDECGDGFEDLRRKAIQRPPGGR